MSTTLLSYGQQKNMPETALHSREFATPGDYSCQAARTGA